MAPKKQIAAAPKRPVARSPFLADGTAANVRGLRKGDLGGAIFGCNHSTMDECISKQLFGLPSAQFSWVRNIGPGLPLFLFNSSKKMLYGVFEAVSPGDMNIDPYAWTDGGKERTPFPAQVRIRMREQYVPLAEKQFYDALMDNYYGDQCFWLELDHTQMTRLLRLFKSFTPRTKTPQPFSTSPFPEMVLAKNKGPSKPVMNAGGSKQSSEPDNPPLGSSNSIGDLTLEYGNKEDMRDGGFEELVSNRDMAPEDMEFRGAGSDWGSGYLHVNMLDTYSHAIPDIDGHLKVFNCNLGETSTSAPQERELEGPSSLGALWKIVPDSSGAGPSETPIELQQNVESFEMVLQKLHKLQSGRQKRPVDESDAAGYVQDDSMPSKKPSTLAEVVQDSTPDLPGDDHEEIRLVKEPSLPKEDEKTMPPDSYQGNAEVVNRNLGETSTSAPQERELEDPSSSLGAAWKIVPGSPGAGPSETPIEPQPNVESFEMVLQKLHKLQSGRQKRPVDESDASGYVQVDSMLSKKPSTSAEEVIDSTPDLPGDDHEEIRLLTEPPSPKEDEMTMPPDSYQGNSELLQTIKELKERTVALEKKQLMSEIKVQHLENVVEVSCTLVEKLKEHVEDLETKLSLVGVPYSKFEHFLDSKKIIYLIGGYNGISWLSTLDSFSPSMDIIRPLKSMNCPRSYASTATLIGNIYVFGGGDGSSCFDSVECYNPSKDEWAWCPNLIRPKGSLAGATSCGKIFAIGGGDGNEYFSDVEMLDLALGKWINVQPLLQKRFSPAAAELNNVVYTVGGYDGKAYLQSVERYDPREGYWTRLSNMSTRRGCLSLAVFNEKLYAMGGYDGEQMVSSVEVFDPRAGTWTMDMPMPTPRGYSAAAVLGDSLFVIGGIQDGQNIVDSVECYQEGSGWAVMGLKAVGKRSFFSAAVL